MTYFERKVIYPNLKILHTEFRFQQARNHHPQYHISTSLDITSLSQLLILTKFEIYFFLLYFSDEHIQILSSLILVSVIFFFLETFTNFLKLHLYFKFSKKEFKYLKKSIN